MLLATGGLIAGTLAAGVGAYENYRNVRISRGQPTPRITELNQNVPNQFGRPRSTQVATKPAVWSQTNYQKKATHPIPKTQLPTRPYQYKNIPMGNIKPSQKITPGFVPGTRYFRTRTIRYKRRSPVRYRRKRKAFSKKKKQ